MTKRVWTIFCCVLLSAMAVLAADVNGKWTAEVPGRDGEKRVTTFTFKADGDKLSGSVANPMGEREISNGKISGDDISFDVQLNMGGNESTMKYTGKVVGDKIELKRETPRGTQEFTAKKVIS